MREIDIQQFAEAHAGGATVIDVREPGEYVAGHVPGATLIPMGQLSSRVQDIDASGPVYLVCASGNRSKSMASLLDQHGFETVNVAGGTNAWVRSGRPVTSGV